MITKSIVVVGPIGQEHHFLVDPPDTQAVAAHGVARHLRDERVQLGGSAYFSAIALHEHGIETRLVTNTGEAGWARNQFRQEFPELRVADESVGPASSYVSLWSPSGSKQLYLRSASDPSTPFLDRFLREPATAIVALSLQKPTTYEHLAETAVEHDRELFVAPNQTLLGRPDEFARIMRVAVAGFINAAESMEAAGAGQLEGVAAWYRGLNTRGTLVVTHSGERLSFIAADGFLSHIELPAAAGPRYSLGGGDMFASFAAANWDGTLSMDAMARASLSASRLMHAVAPFERDSH